uniref:Flavin-containing monooxygenase n=1 Tax=Acrobeloides nanus TaxID=290746 RepID=A0A914C713_9BILA
MSKTIGIIGAGPAGICAARRCYEAGYKDIKVFEQASDLGGIWLYSPEINGYSSMYEKLNTNGPKEFMSYEGFPVPDRDGSGRSFISRQDVFEYVKEFAAPIRQFIWIYLLYKEEPGKPKLQLPSNVVQLREVIDADSEGLILNDGQKLNDIDAVIYCTGYRYNFPFFDDSIVRTLEGGKIVTPLFEHVVHRDYLDSLFFIGIPLYSIFALLEEYQVKFALSLIQNRAKLPSRDEIDNWETNRIKELKARNLSLKFFHAFKEPHEQWDYYKRLAQYADVIYAVPNVYIKIDLMNRKFFDERVCTFKRVIYKIVNDEEFTWHDSEMDDYD